MSNQPTLTALISALNEEHPNTDWSACDHAGLGDLDCEDVWPYPIPDTPAIIAPGWYSEEDGCGPIGLPTADSRSEAVTLHVEGGDYGDGTETVFVAVTTWRVAYYLDEDGDLAETRIDLDSTTREVEPEEPECLPGRDHDWQSPFSLLGGLRENPGVQSHGGGIMMREVCAHCGAQMLTDTWAQNPATGEQGLRSVEYQESTEETREWALVGILEDIRDCARELDEEEFPVLHLRVTEYISQIQLGAHSREEAQDFLSSVRLGKGDVDDWDTVDTYSVVGEDMEGDHTLYTTSIQIGTAHGLWYGRTDDDAGGSDEAPEDAVAETREGAEEWAHKFARTWDESPDSDEVIRDILAGGWFDSEVVADRLRELAGMVADPDQDWSLWIDRSGYYSLDAGGNAYPSEPTPSVIIIPPTDGGVDGALLAIGNAIQAAQAND